MKKINSLFAIAAIALTAVFCLASCDKNDDNEIVYPSEYYQMVNLQPNTSVVLWNPADFNFEFANSYYLQYYADKEKGIKSAPGCSSWRNGRFHGRNLDWYQANYGCLIIQMPKGGKVTHASVALLNSNTTVTQEFIKKGVISGADRSLLPCMVVDGINDAGVAVNINIVPHDPNNSFITTEGNLSSQCVVRYILDNAGSVTEAIKLLEGKKVRQSIVKLAGDETHYMISDKDETAVVEFENGNMVVTHFKNNGNGCYSDKGNPAIMTNLYDFAVEKWGIGTDEFYENSPYAMGIERWNTIKGQYDRAANSVEDNLEIAKSVWYFKNFMQNRDNKWYSENAVPSSWAKDADGWHYYVNDSIKVATTDCKSAQIGFWNSFMKGYWAKYDKEYGSKEDPHVEGNSFWETSHTVIYDLDAKRGYLYPFENYYSKNGKPIVIALPNQK